MSELTWKRRTHNPEVAGSNPARATKELQFTGVVERSAPLSFTRGWVPPIPRLTPDPGGFERHAHSDSVIGRCSSHVSTGPLFFGAGHPQRSSDEPRSERQTAEIGGAISQARIDSGHQQDGGKAEQESGGILDVLRRVLDVPQPRRQIGRRPARGRQPHRRIQEVGTDHDEEQEQDDQGEGGQAAPLLNAPHAWPPQLRDVGYVSTTCWWA